VTRCAAEATISSEALWVVVQTQRWVSTEWEGLTVAWRWSEAAARAARDDFARTDDEHAYFVKLIDNTWIPGCGA
jgi:hypothetical protein